MDLFIKLYPPQFVYHVFFCIEFVFPFQESVTDYTTPSSSLADSVPTGGNKMEESLVANVSTHVHTDVVQLPF